MEYPIPTDWRNPPVSARPIPFWSWNDCIDDERARWQIDEMAKAGMGGFFIHARTGLNIPYMSREWFDRIRTCIDRAKEDGLAVWLYDEDGWPSGFAGGAVTALGDRYHARGLKIEKLADAAEAGSIPNLLGIYRTDGAMGRLTGDAPSGGPAYAVSHTAGPYYIDVLNAQVVREFIDRTHERYYQEFGSEFGKTIRGFFTDEPRLSEGDIPWSYILPDEFRKHFGYDIVDRLPALFATCDGYEKVRYDFWKLVSELFTTSFMKQISDWCAAHHVALTGHVMMEESLYSQMTGTAGSMPFYEYMDIPGIDWLRRPIGNDVITRQVGSAACQLGRKQVISESFALSGWNVSFAELRRIVEWQYLSGVNLLCPHLQSFTLRGFRKRDYPPSMFFQQPWWPEYHRFTEYVSRLGRILSDSRETADVLVIHPMGSAWVAYDGTNNPTIAGLDSDLIALTGWLGAAHVDFHFGDETILRRHAHAENGTVTVGSCSYHTVFLPPMLTIDESTYRLLDDFSRQGGRIIRCGHGPQMIGGVPDKRLASLKAHMVMAGRSADGLRQALRDTCPVHVRSGGNEIADIRLRQMEYNGRRLFFLVNLSTEQTYDAEIEIPGAHGLRRLNLETAGEETVSCRDADGKAVLCMTFEPMQSCLLAEAEPDAAGQPETPVRRIPAAAGVPWRITRCDPNSLTLDVCRYRIDGGEWQGPVPVIRLMDILLKLRRACDIDMRFGFDTAEGYRPDGPFHLVMEKAAEHRILINGTSVSAVPDGWWKDTEFQTLDIRPYVRAGRNEIMLSRRFYQSPKVYDVIFGKDVYETEKNKLTYDVELESIYLAGGFGVEIRSGVRQEARRAVHTMGPFVITPPPRTVRDGDLTEQGFAFFAGTVDLSRTVRVEKETGVRYELTFTRPDAVAVRIFVNGRDGGLLQFPPYRLDVTDLLADGDNELTLRLYGSNRNLLGPHHRAGGESYAVGPETFTERWSWCDRKGEAYRSTEEEKKADYWREGYSLVRFGLREEPSR